MWIWTAKWELSLALQIAASFPTIMVFALPYYAMCLDLAWYVTPSLTRFTRHHAARSSNIHAASALIDLLLQVSTHRPSYTRFQNPAYIWCPGVPNASIFINIIVY